MIETRTRDAYEIFEKIDALKTKEERVKALKELDNDMIDHLIVLGLNDYVSSNIILPDSVPVPRTSEDDENGLYYPASEENFPATLSREYKKLNMFVEMAKPVENKIRLERTYLGILEGIHPKDAEMLANIMAGNWPYKKITKAVVNEARPDLLRKPGWAV